MKIEIGIIEDQKTELILLTEVLKKWSEDSGHLLETNSFSSGEEYFSLKKKPVVQLFFLDIQLGGMDGVAIAQRLRNENFNGHIIFLTAFREYVFRGYQVRAFNYLLKPIHLKELSSCMNEVVKDLSGNAYIFRSKTQITQIPYIDIITFTSSMHYVDILTATTSYCQYTTLNNVLGYLPSNFIRCHRCAIVNMAHIYTMSGNQITLSNKLHITIGRSYIPTVQEAFCAYSDRFNHSYQ